MVGAKPKLGLGTTTLPALVASMLRTEEDLSALSLPSTSPPTLCMDCGQQEPDGDQCWCDTTAEPRAAVERRQAGERQQAQAHRMLKQARSRSTARSVTNVTVGITDVDRSRIEHQHLICVVY